MTEIQFHECCSFHENQLSSGGSKFVDDEQKIKLMNYYLSTIDAIKLIEAFFRMKVTRARYQTSIAIESSMEE